MLRYLSFILLVWFWVIAMAGVAQTPDTTTTPDARQVEITTMDWDVIRGTIIGQEDHAFVVQTYGGIEMTIPFEEVREMREISGPQDTRPIKAEKTANHEWFDNKHGYSYLVSGSYLFMPKNTGVVRNTYLTTSTFRYSFSDNFTLGGGFEAISAVLLNPAFLISPKVHFKLGENWYGGATLSYAGILTTWLFEGGSGIGVAQLGTTVGTTERNFTVGGGWTVIGGDLAQSPFVNFGGVIRFSRRFAFVTDNLLAPLDAQYFPVVSYGLRYLGRDVSGQLVFVNTPALFEFVGPGLPVFSLSVHLD